MNELDFMVTLLEQDLSEMSAHIYMNAGNKLLNKSIDKDGEAADKKKEAEKVFMKGERDSFDKGSKLLDDSKKASEKGWEYYRRSEKLYKHGEQRGGKRTFI